MSLYVDPPFDLGQTLGVSSTADGKAWVGAVKVFTDVVPSTGAVRSNRVKKCVAVRNMSGAALLPKRLVKFSTTAGTAGISEVTGYADATNAEFVGVVDEFLPSAGVADKDVFWVVVDGPTEVAHALSGTAVAAGNKLAAITAATSGATTAGRVTPSGVGAATTGAGDNGLGVIGYALSAGTTNGNAILALIRTNVA
jgi:hypothetical protein